MELQFRPFCPLSGLGCVSACMWNRGPVSVAAKMNLVCLYQNWWSDRTLGDQAAHYLCFLNTAVLIWVVTCLRWVHCVDGISSWWVFPSRDTIFRDDMYLCHITLFGACRRLVTSWTWCASKERLFNMWTISLRNPGCAELIVYGLAYGGHVRRLPNVWKLHTNVESPHVSGTISRSEERAQPLKGCRSVLWMCVSFVVPHVLFYWKPHCVPVGEGPPVLWPLR